MVEYPFYNQYLYPPQPEPRNQNPSIYSGIFDEPDEGYPYAQQSVEKPPSSFAESYKALAARKTGPAMTAYQEYLKKGYPEQQSPGKLTRLGAILSGAAAGWKNPSEGVEVAQRILDRPYLRQIEQYKNEGGRLREGAVFEESRNQHEIAAMNLIAQHEQRQREYDRNLANDADRRLTSATTRRKNELDINNYLSPQRRLEIAAENARTGRTETFANQREIQTRGFRNTQARQEAGFDNQAMLQEDRFANEAIRDASRQQFTAAENEKNRKAVDARNTARLARPETINQARQLNGTVVDSMIKRDKKYIDLKVVEPTPDGYKMIENPGPGNGDAKALRKYQAYVELFNALYNGIKGIEPLPPAVR